MGMHGLNNTAHCVVLCRQTAFYTRTGKNRHEYKRKNSSLAMRDYTCTPGKDVEVDAVLAIAIEGGI